MPNGREVARDLAMFIDEKTGKAGRGGIVENLR